MAMNFVSNTTAEDYSEAAEILKEEAKREKGREAQRQYRKRKRQSAERREAVIVKQEIEIQELKRKLRNVDESPLSSSTNQQNDGSM